jgi:hypothetical protein
MRRSSSVWVLCAALGVAPCAARADDVHLSGGNVIEGKVSRDQGHVTVEMESGRITLSADSVERIDRRESTVEHFERAYAALKPDDVKARLALADYCREHDMHSREKQLLHEVIERAPDHSEARARLGFVKSDGGWITREEQYRAQGMVQVDGVWMTRDKALELARLHEQAQLAQRDRERAEAALEAERVGLRKQQLELEQKRAENQRNQNYVTPIYGGYGGYFYSGGFCGPGERCRDGHAWSTPASPQTQPFPINGVRDPRDPSWPINGVRDPRQRLRTP